MFTKSPLVRTVATVGAFALAVALTGCTSSTSGTAEGSSSPDVIQVVAAESQYGNVASIIGGDKVKVTSLVDSPAVDPHDIGATPKVAKTIANANIVVTNGAGYDDWMDELAGDKTTVSAQSATGVAQDVANPHLWYGTQTMPKVAAKLVTEYTKLNPGAKSYFEANLAKFNKDMRRYTSALATFKAKYSGTKVAVTEPVANMLIEAAGAKVATPANLQASLMEGNDPSAQDSATQEALFTENKVKAFVYNKQVTSSMTEKYLSLATEHKIPVVAAYEIMPTGMSYVDWMVAEVTALSNAVGEGTSTQQISSK